MPVADRAEHYSNINLTFSLDTNAYASGDLLADTQELASAVRASDGYAVLTAIELNDEDDQGVAMYVVLLDANVSLGTENSAPSISDANARNILSIVPVATTDWQDLGGVRVATLRNLSIPVKSASGSTSIYVGLLNGTGTPTFTAAGIRGRFTFDQN